VIPSDITLMHPTFIARPFHREGWVYEEKYDGWRILACKSEGKVHLLSRNGRDHARRFGEVARVVASIPEDILILDGEVAIFDEQLISRFEWLRHGSRESLATPPIYMVFDVPQVGSGDTASSSERTAGCCRLSQDGERGPAGVAQPRDLAATALLGAQDALREAERQLSEETRKRSRA
jgi:bifunctional non-homologous end joining protein LigD